MSEPRVKRAYVIFDHEHDEDVRQQLLAQSRQPDSPFEIVDWSKPDGGEARTRLRAVDVAVVLCGEYTARAPGVNAELRIAQEEGVPYFLLRGRFEIWTKPDSAMPIDKTYGWTWPHLKTLIGGGR